MQGYDRQEAVAYMMSRVDKKAHRALAGQLESLLKQAVDLDLRYMRQAGVLTPEGLAGDRCYDDDEAFEFLLEEMVRQRGVGEDGEGLIAAFLDDYMDLQQQFLEQKGLLEWDG